LKRIFQLQIRNVDADNAAVDVCKKINCLLICTRIIPLAHIRKVLFCTGSVEDTSRPPERPHPVIEQRMSGVVQQEEAEDKLNQQTPDPQCDSITGFTEGAYERRTKHEQGKDKASEERLPF